jgi:hypothetical protein
VSVRSDRTHRSPSRALTEPPRDGRSWCRLPGGLADFARRGFRLDRPAARVLLEGHARSFLDGFGLSQRGDGVHAALAALPDSERGFGYEGAGMRAALLDQVRGGQGHLDRLLSGPGAGYVHLIHVGAGWGGGMLRSRWLTRVPRTPLLRWLALDGSGFARCFFDAGRSVRAVHPGRPIAAWQEAELAGVGRALWFVHSADAPSVARAVGAAPAAARASLWSGVGLACAYAGGADVDSVELLLRAAGPDRDAFGQGVAFAAAARTRSSVVPVHTETVSELALGVGAAEATAWTDAAATGLDARTDLAAYLTWKSRIRERTHRSCLLVAASPA